MGIVFDLEMKSESCPDTDSRWPKRPGDGLVIIYIVPFLIFAAAVSKTVDVTLLVISSIYHAEPLRTKSVSRDAGREQPSRSSVVRRVTVHATCASEDEKWSNSRKIVPGS